VAFDLEAEVVAALRSSSGREALAEALRPVIAAEMARALAAQQDTPKPLAEIWGVSAETARGRERRDPELRKLAIKSGRRRVYLPHQVVEHMRLRAKSNGRSTI
jgi:hypothetical protein